MLHFPLSFPRKVSRFPYVVYRQRRSSATQTTTSSYLPALTPLLFLPAALGHGEVKVGSGSFFVISLKSETDRFRVPGVYGL